jgi:hypothetical protein
MRRSLLTFPPAPKSLAVRYLELQRLRKIVQLAERKDLPEQEVLTSSSQINPEHRHSA